MDFGSDILNIEPRHEPLGKCKKCSKKAPAKDFKIHDVLKIMVCKNCFSSSTLSLISQKDVKEEKSEEKEVILPRTIVIREEEDVFRKIDRPERIKRREEMKKEIIYKKIKCDQCTFTFKYNPKKNWPGVCPSCGKDVKDIKKSFF
jgi:hypothetical protein